MQAHVPLRPVLNVFECFLGAEGTQSNDVLCREVGLAQEIADDSGSKT